MRESEERVHPEDLPAIGQLAMESLVGEFPILSELRRIGASTFVVLQTGARRATRNSTALIHNSGRGDCKSNRHQFNSIAGRIRFPSDWL